MRISEPNLSPSQTGTTEHRNEYSSPFNFASNPIVFFLTTFCNSFHVYSNFTYHSGLGSPNEWCKHHTVVCGFVNFLIRNLIWIPLKRPGILKRILKFENRKVWPSSCKIFFSFERSWTASPQIRTIYCFHNTATEQNKIIQNYITIIYESAINNRLRHEFSLPRQEVFIWWR